MTQAFSHNFSP